MATQNAFGDCRDIVRLCLVQRPGSRPGSRGGSPLPLQRRTAWEAVLVLHTA